MNQIDIVFNIEYPEHEDFKGLKQLYDQVNEYVEYIQVHTVTEFIRLVSLLKPETTCLIWVHPSHSSKLFIDSAVKSEIETKCVPWLEQKNIPFRRISRSGKLNIPNTTNFSNWLDAKSESQVISAADILALIKPKRLGKLDKQDVVLSKRIEDSIRNDVKEVNKSLLDLRKYLVEKIETRQNWTSLIFPESVN